MFLKALHSFFLFTLSVTNEEVSNVYNPVNRIDRAELLDKNFTIQIKGIKILH